MEQLKKLLASLSTSQRWTILVAAVLISGGLYSLVHWEKESAFRPLYTTLAPEDASVVIQKLKEGSTEYRLSNNGTTILVPEDKVAELRLELAAAGVPKSGRVGFEIFDKTKFGQNHFRGTTHSKRRGQGGTGARPQHVPERVRVQRSAAAGQGQRADQDQGRRESARDRDPRDHAS